LNALVQLIRGGVQISPSWVTHGKFSAGRSLTASHLRAAEQLDTRIRELRPEDIPACASILSDLPEWFGLPESNRAYVDGLSNLPAAVAEHAGRVIGFLSLRSHNDRAAEIEAMAILPDLHHRGVGRSLVRWALQWCRSEGVLWLHVKTRGPSTPDPYYARTRKFYQAVGFDPLFESTALWGPEDAALILVCKVESIG
jgi:N-acetylglutamate synthase-like GNAT family acetyltransferase